MTTTKLGQYNEALLLLKQTTLTTVADDILARYRLDDAWTKATNKALEEGVWHFAVRTVAIPFSSDVTPAFGWNYAFLKPTDYVRTVALSSNMYFTGPFNDWDDDGTYWWANWTPLYVKYVSNDTSLGGYNLGTWPESFCTYQAHELAERVAPLLTSMSGAEKEEFRKEKKRALADARAKASFNLPAMRPPSGRLVRARKGYRGYVRPGDWPWNG